MTLNRLSGQLVALAELGLTKQAEFAPGIPSSKPTARLPKITPATMNKWTLAVQQHEAARAGNHYDLRLVDPDSAKAHSWALPKARLPEPGEKLLAVQTFTHTPDYALHFGEKKPEIIGKGYGKGTVKLVVKEPVDIVEASNDKVRFNVYQGKDINEYMLRRTNENKWLLFNTTTTKAKEPNIPQSKPKYKSLEPDKVDVTDDNQLMMGKIDGSHCFLGHVRINTKEYGTIPIGLIVNQQLNVHVESVDLNTNTVLWKRVTQYYKRENPGNFYQLTIQGLHTRRITATGNHPIETPLGKIPIEKLKKDDIVWTVQEEPSEQLKQIIIGMLLGDGSISKGTHNYRLCCTHSQKQKNYCYKKYELLKHFCPQTPTEYTVKNSYAPEKIRFYTRTYPFFTQLRPLFYDEEGKRRLTEEFTNQLTEISLAFWFLDDGHVSVADNKHGKNRQLFLGLHTEALSRTDTEKLINILKQRWNISSRINTDTNNYTYIGMGAEAAQTFLELIAPWIPDTSLKYLGQDYYKYNNKIIDLIGTKYHLLTEQIKPVRTLKKNTVVSNYAITVTNNNSNKHVYNLEVEDTHRYVIQDLLVSNCTFLLREQQPVRIYSYRPTERATGLIEHTQRFLPAFQSRVPKHLDNIVLRGELYATDPVTGQSRAATDTGAVLNSGVWRSRDLQTHSPLRAVIFDVARRQGQSTEALPYAEKLKVLESVSRALPFLELPPMANTAKEKIELLNRIRTGQEPSTSEGVVLWPMEGGAPIKAKFRPDHDVYVREIFPEEGSRNLAGGFTYSWTPYGKIQGRVGTGFDHALKKDMLENPKKYTGRVAKVRAMEVYRDKDNPKRPGALRAPSFTEFHLDKGYQPLEEKQAQHTHNAKLVNDPVTGPVMTMRRKTKK